LKEDQMRDRVLLVGSVQVAITDSQPRECVTSGAAFSSLMSSFEQKAYQVAKKAR
jgi:hypothetical protein